MTITQNQKALLENALYAAVEVYNKDYLKAVSAGDQPTAEQFATQRYLAVKLAEAVADCDFVRFENA